MSSAQSTYVSNAFLKHVHISLGQDAEECIRLEPTFSKGYSRKGPLQFFMKDYDAALETYEAGLKHDPDNAELKEGINRALEGLAKVICCPVTRG